VSRSENTKTGGRRKAEEEFRARDDQGKGCRTKAVRNK
jgi:hypothetical protein